jgi:hypothetical protein
MMWAALAAASLLAACADAGPTASAGAAPRASVVPLVWDTHRTAGTTADLNGVDFDYAVGGRGTILRYSGEGWRRMKSPTTQTLNAVYRALPSVTMFAVGQNGTILRLDSLEWVVVRSGGQNLYDISSIPFSGPNNLFAVGAAGTILRSDGAAWNPMPSGTTAALEGVSMASATFGLAVGEGGTILRFDGSTWSPMTSGTTARLRSVDARSPTLAYAVGDGGTILKWNGAAWSPMSGGQGTRLWSVVAINDTAALAVGGYDGTVLRLSKGTWSVLADSAHGPLYDVTIKGPLNGPVIVGAAGTILHGTAPAPTQEPWLAVWARADSNVVAVGRNGTLAHFDGTAWYSYATTTRTSDFNDVWGYADTLAYAVGSSGVIVRWNGRYLQRVPSGATRTLFGVWGTGPANVFAVGFGGTIVHFDGGAWTAMPSPTTKTLRDVWGTSTSNAFASGDDGTLLHYNGVQWEPFSAPPADSAGHIFALWRKAPGPLWAGTQGGLYRWEANTWTRELTTPVTVLHGQGDSAAVALTPGGIRRWDGTTWHAAQPLAALDLWMLSPASLWAAGPQGILHGRP